MPEKKIAQENPKGKEDISIAHDMDRKAEKKYPGKEERDSQYDNQPEFTDRESSRKDEEEV